MGRIKVNLVAVESYDVIPDDTYTFEITKVRKDMEKNYLYWDMVVVSGEISENEYVGCRVIHFTSLKPSALWNLKALVQAVGADFDEDGFDDEDLIGEQFSSQTKVEPWDGKDQTKLNPKSFTAA